MIKRVLSVIGIMSLISLSVYADDFEDVISQYGTEGQKESEFDRIVNQTEQQEVSSSEVSLETELFVSPGESDKVEKVSSSQQEFSALSVPNESLFAPETVPISPEHQEDVLEEEMTTDTLTSQQESIQVRETPNRNPIKLTSEVNPGFNAPDPSKIPMTQGKANDATSIFSQNRNIINENKIQSTEPELLMATASHDKKYNIRDIMTVIAFIFSIVSFVIIWIARTIKELCDPLRRWLK